jgi:predicted AAA+ superfamily ATPase
MSKDTWLHERIARGGVPELLYAASPGRNEVRCQAILKNLVRNGVEPFVRIDGKGAFLRFLENLAARSGAKFDASSYASTCGVSHTTIHRYLEIACDARLLHRLHSFHACDRSEIQSESNVYFFDGAFARNLGRLDPKRGENLIILWRHSVLNELICRLQPADALLHWRDKRHHEIDFVLKDGSHAPKAILCDVPGSGHRKRIISSANAFLRRYPGSDVFLVLPIFGDIDSMPYDVPQGISVLSLDDLVRRLLL